MNVVYIKRMLYYGRGSFPRLELYVSRDFCVIIQNVIGSHLLRCLFVHTFSHNLQAIGLILAFYIPNDYGTL